LRERREDIPYLAQELLARIAARHRRVGLTLTAPALARLTANDWPGNVRELEHCLERAAIITSGPIIAAEALALVSAPAPVVGTPTLAAPMLAETERSAIVAALHATGGRIYGAHGAAIRLGLPPSTLQHRMHKLGISKS